MQNQTVAEPLQTESPALDHSILEALDFAIPCESPDHPEGKWDHEGPGHYLVLPHACPKCGAAGMADGVYVLCESFVDHWYSKQARCNVCEGISPMYEAFTIIGTVGGGS